MVHRDAALPALTMDYVAELLAAGQCHWALYVLQHSLAPTSPLGRAGTAGAPQVQRLAQEVLALYCPVWSTSEEQRAFIETDLGMPLAWMDQAQVGARESACLGVRGALVASVLAAWGAFV